jgi:tetratricopeptide (TPR) repeat protein
MRFHLLSNLLLIATLLFWPAQTRPQPSPSIAKNANQWALLVGVNDYPGEIQDLRFARNDAREIKNLLIASAGFAEDHVRLLTDDGIGAARASKQNIYAAIDQYLAQRMQTGHQLIVFMAGHGISQGYGTEARSYFLPVDAEAQTKESLVRTAIDLEELSRKLAALPAAQFTVFVDACREDPFPGRGLKGNTMTDVMARGLRIVRHTEPQAPAPPPTSIVFYSCRVGERAYENAELQHGVFTYYILRGIRELAASPNGRVEAGQLAGYLTSNVRKWAEEHALRAKVPIEQTPVMMATEVRGPVFIVNVSPFSAGGKSATASSGAVSLNSSPEGALLSINGQAAGTGPLFKELQPGQYTVRAELPGFQPFETKINLIAGYRQEVTLTLQPSVANQSYDRGVQFENQQLWPQAIAAYEQALREDPNAVAVYERLANVYLKNNRYDQAITLLRTATQKFTGNALLLAQLSRALSASVEQNGQNNLTDTARLADDSTSGKKGGSIEPEDEGSGKESKKSGKKSEEKGGKKGSKKSESKKDGKGGGKKDDDVAGDKPSSNQSASGAIDEAIRAALAALALDARLSSGHLALGFAYLLDGQNRARATAAFVQASTITSDDAEAYYGVGYAYLLQQQYQQALPQLKKAVELRPDYYEAQRELANCYSALGQTDLAIRQYQLTSGHRRKVKNSDEVAANNLALAALYRKKGEEVGGAQGEEYKKAGKGYESEAREYDPTLKGAAKRLTSAGLSKVIENLLPDDARKFVEPAKPPADAEIKIPVKGPVKINVPVNIPVKSPVKSKEPVKSPVKAPVKEPVKEKTKDKEPAKSPVKQPIRPPVKITVPVKPPAKDPARKPAEESEKKPEKKSEEKPVRKPVIELKKVPQ